MLLYGAYNAARHKKCQGNNNCGQSGDQGTPEEVRNEGRELQRHSDQTDGCHGDCEMSLKRVDLTESEINLVVSSLYNSGSTIKVNLAAKIRDARRVILESM